MKKLLRIVLLVVVMAWLMFLGVALCLKHARVKEFTRRIAEAEHLECRIHDHLSVIDLTPDVRNSLMKSLSDHISFPLGFEKMVFQGTLFFSNLDGTNLVIEVFNNNNVIVDGVQVELSTDVLEVCGMKDVANRMKRLGGSLLKSNIK